MKVNLACGGVYVNDTDWLNLDYASSSPAVQRANLLGRLPLQDASADLIYSSHFLEHIPREHVPPFLLECRRILKPGGVLRLVVPDLANLCRAYLHHRDHGEHEKADFLTLELLDQCVRSRRGGDMGILFQNLKADPKKNKAIIAFVSERTGEDLTRAPLPLRRLSLRTVLRLLPARAETLWIRAVIRLLPRAFREQNVSMARVGERHHWLYDAYSLKQLLSACGFDTFELCTASTTRVPNFPCYPLDLHGDGRPRKGIQSLYVEAQKFW